MAKFKEILAELRKDRGLSQKELANAFHVSGSTISSYETGVHSPDIDQIIQFADFFDVSISQRDWSTGGSVWRLVLLAACFCHSGR